MGELHIDEIQQHPFVQSLTQLHYDKGYDDGVVETLHYIKKLIGSVFENDDFVELIKNDWGKEV